MTRYRPSVTRIAHRRIRRNGKRRLPVPPLNQPPTISSNTGLSVVELSTGNVIGLTNLLTTDPDNTIAELVYTLQSVPSNGVLKNSGTTLAFGDTWTQSDINSGLLTYDSTTAEVAADSFFFSVTDGVNNPRTGSFGFTITPPPLLNSPPSVTTNVGINVVEGTTSNVIASTNLRVTDPDDGPSELTYTVTAVPAGGLLKLSGATLSVNDTFTQADVDAGSLTYDQTSPGSTSDFFTFSCADGGEDGAQPATGTFSMTVQPPSTNQPPSLSANNQLSVQVGSIGNVIGSSWLSVTDPDDAPSDLTYTITANVGAGALRLSGVALAKNGTFTQADIDAGSLTYDQLPQLPFGPFSLSSSGNSIVFQDDNNDIVDAVPSSVGTNALWSVFRTASFAGGGALPGVACDITNATGPSPSSYQMKKISIQYHTSSNELRIIDSSNEEGNPALEVTITNVVKPAVVNAATKLKEFKITSSSVFEYSQDSLVEMSINSTLSAASDSFQFSCADGGENGAQPVVGTFTILFPGANQQPVLATNSPLAVSEGATVKIPRTKLEVTDLDDGPSELTYTVTAVPVNGTLLRNQIALGVNDVFTQADINSAAIDYAQTVPSQTSDSFGFSCADGGEDGTVPVSGTFNIAITDVPPVNAPPEITSNTGITVNEGSTGNVVAQSALEVTDPDDPATDLRYTITSNPVAGSLFKSAAQMGVGDTFTQQSINSGNITYDQTSPGSLVDSFSWSCTDDFNPPVTGTTSITITQISSNSPPVLQANTGMTVIDGSTGNIITSGRLQFTDAEEGPSQIVYTLTTVPLGGDLKRSGTVLVQDDTITQADINAGSITYDQNVPATSADSFSFDVTDGINAAISGVFNITVTTIPVGGSTPPPSDSGNNRGMNVGSNTDFDDYLVFGDALRQTSWIPHAESIPNEFRRSFNIDESSSPQTPDSRGLVPFRGKTGDQYTLRIRSTANYANPGSATVEVLGVTYTADAVITLPNDVEASTVLITAIDNTVDTWNTVVELWHPGQVGNLFHSDYIDPLKNTAGVGQNTGIIRFLNWSPINRQRGNQQPDIITVNDIVEPNRPCQGGTQFRSSPALQFDFADAIGADPWICIPHKADDGLVDHIAGLASAWKTANPTKRVYIEFSNELWNAGTFQQARDARDLGKLIWPQLPDESIGEWNVRAMANWTGQNAARVFNRIDQTFTDYESVVAWQAAANHSFNFVFNEFIATRTGAAIPKCWAIAPYSNLRIPTQKAFVNGYEQQIVPGAADQNDVIDAGEQAAVDALISAEWTPEEIMRILNTQAREGLDESRKQVRTNFTFTQSKGMRLVAYEGGHHLLPRVQYAGYDRDGTGLNFEYEITYPQYTANFIAASEHPEMYAHLRALEDIWVQEGGQEACWLVYIQFPRSTTSGASFGHRHSMDDDANPKWLAFADNVADDIVRSATLPGW